MAYTNSPLVSYTKLSPNCTKPRNHVIDTITPHCVVGQLSAQATLNLAHFVNYDPNRGASCNYAIGHKGEVGMGVEEAKHLLSEHANPRKWVCVEAESVVVENVGDVILYVMADTATAEAVKTAFLDLK